MGIPNRDHSGLRGHPHCQLQGDDLQVCVYDHRRHYFQWVSEFDWQLDSGRKYYGYEVSDGEVEGWDGEEEVFVEWEVVCQSGFVG